MKARLLTVCCGLGVLGLAVVTAGCAPKNTLGPDYVATGNLDDVKPGMNGHDVGQIMGSPLRREVVDHSERLYPLVWVYPQGKVFIRVSPGMWGPNYTVTRVENDSRLANVEINSEPQGARIYEKGRLKGTAPLVLAYRIDDAAFQSGAIELAPMVAVHDTCRPGQVQLRLEVDPAWREGKPSGPHCFGHLFLLERDPNYKPPTIIVQQPQPPSGDNVNVNVQTQRDKDALDYLEQAGRVGIIMKTLKAMGR